MPPMTTSFRSAAAAPTTLKPTAAQTAAASITFDCLSISLSLFEALQQNRIGYRLFRLFYCRRHNLRITPEPVGFLHKLTVMHLEDLHPASAFVISRCDLERREKTAEREVVDLLEPVLDIFAGRLPATLGFDRVSDRLGMDSRYEETAIVDHRVFHHTLVGSFPCALYIALISWRTGYSSPAPANCKV